MPVEQKKATNLLEQFTINWKYILPYWFYSPFLYVVDETNGFGASPLLVNLIGVLLFVLLFANAIRPLFSGTLKFRYFIFWVLIFPALMGILMLIVLK